MKIIKIFLILIICFSTNLKASDDFDLWLNDFSKKARDSGISNDTINIVLKNARFLPKVIKYDRYQPEFYEDTKTYVNKRVTNNKIENGKKLYKKI